MKPESGIKERTVEGNDVGNDRKSEGTEQFILTAEQRSWQEPLDIIATGGLIRGIKL